MHKVLKPYALRCKAEVIGDPADISLRYRTCQPQPRHRHAHRYCHASIHRNGCRCCLGGRADAGPATTTVALNIITSASKTESLLFKVSLLHFRTIARNTAAGMMIGRIPQMGYFVFDSALEIPRGGPREEPSGQPTEREVAQRLPSIHCCRMLNGRVRV